MDRKSLLALVTRHPGSAAAASLRPAPSPPDAVYQAALLIRRRIRAALVDSRLEASEGSTR